jgi:glycosyltransferase involved in cell wall biosynthesis
VITSNISSLPEVAGDAALMVDPTDLDAIVESLRRLIDDSALRSSLIAKGLARTQTFTWDRSAQQLRQIYTQLLTS